MKKKMLAWTMVLTLVISLLMTALPASAMKRTAYAHTSSGCSLNIRGWAHPDADIVGHIPYGGELVIIGDYDDGTWVSINYDGQEGYVMWRYLTYERPAPKPKPAPAPKPAPKPAPDLSTIFNGFRETNYIARVCPNTPGGIVHMRWAPSTAMPILQDYHQNSQLQVIADNKTWCQVRDPETGVTGFMMKSFLNDIGFGTAN